MSFSTLSPNSYMLLHLLAFIGPDGIDKAILVKGLKLYNQGEEFDFLSDEIDLVSAETELLQASLIDKSTDSAFLSIHPSVQNTAIRKLSDSDRSQYFDASVRLVTCGFPNTWREDVGHQFQTWAKCEKYLAHVNHLVKHAKAYSINPMTPQLYGELLLRYLYEREWYTVAQDFVDIALETFENKTSLAFASAVDLSGLIDLDMNNPSNALVSFNSALSIRGTLLGPEDPLIASSFNNIALSYTETGDLEKAYSAHEKALSIRLRAETRVDNTYSNMSSLLLQMGKPDEAEEMMQKCPALKDFTDDSFINTGNPRYVGNMVLLSRIRLDQGRLDDAMRFASKALTFRQKLQGNRLKTCDSLYDVADMLVREGRVSSAV
ncbi:hypothetical protein VE02_01046 [Pseudogymnoascus sp. 03VT05]|nr:hypothetical protein VE02_01046 [Pseudogymnoascus sp. 03VT05]